MELSALPVTAPSFQDQVSRLFEEHFSRLYRVVARLTGEPELASDVVQEAFVRLVQRGSLPDDPAAWLISVAMNLVRNEKTTRGRRLRLLTPERGAETLADPPPSPDEAMSSEASRLRVREALDRIPERERRLLLLQSEGYRYREIAAALKLNEKSVGVLLARARRMFRESYEEDSDASR